MHNTTLLIKRNKDGSRKLCDYRCYRSPSSPKGCKCICNGINHGVGLKKAIEQTLEHRDYYEALGLEVVVEDRLLFEIDPAREKKKVKTLKFRKRFDES